MNLHNPLTVVNVLANCLIVVSMTHLVLRVFGRPDSSIYRNKFAAIVCKVAACVTICGAVSNILTLSTPTWTEVLLNFGVSLNFLWLNHYASSSDSKHSPAGTKVHQRDASSRSAGARKAKPRPPSSRQRRERSAGSDD